MNQSNFCSMWPPGLVSTCYIGVCYSNEETLLHFFYSNKLIYYKAACLMPGILVANECKFIVERKQLHYRKLQQVHINKGRHCCSDQ